MLKSMLKKVYYALLKLWYGRGYNAFGTGSVLKKPIRILGKNRMEIGSCVHILDGLRMEAISKWGGEKYTPVIKICDNVVIGQYCHFTCANRLEIGEGTSVLPNVLITDIEHEYVAGKSLSETGIEVGSVVIGKYVTIGMGARILGGKGITIGDNSIIGTNAVVTHDVPANTIVAGVPARVIGRNE